MIPRKGHLSNLLSLLLLIIGLTTVIILGSVLATCFSALFLVFAGSEVPSFPDLASEAMATDHWMIIAEMIRGFGCLGLVGLLLVRLDRRPFQLSALGLTWKPNPGLMILSGLLVTSLLFLGAGCLATLRGVENGVSESLRALSQIGGSGFVLLAVSALANAFWQELAFRSYLQPRLQCSYGILPGILICSFVFVALHGLIRPVGGGELITGTTLFCLIGWLFFVSNSVVLATALHATGNLFLNLFADVGLILPPLLDRSLVYALGLVLALTIFKRRASPSPQKDRPVPQTEEAEENSI
jgi:membrane protease YdiL (CAAX protease family)